VKGFEEKLRDWSENLRPARALAGPALDQPGSSGPKVRYAISFANRGGEGPRGDYGDAYRLAPGADESLSHIAVDPLGLALSRKVYRSTDGRADELVAIIPNNDATKWPWDPSTPPLKEGTDVARATVYLEAFKKEWVHALTKIAMAPDPSDPEWNPTELPELLGDTALIALKQSVLNGQKYCLSMFLKDMTMINGIISGTAAKWSPRHEKVTRAAVAELMPWVDPNC
jgi:hypothetical protein